MNHSPLTFAYAALSLLGFSGLADRVAESDFDRELRKVKGLADLPEKRLSEKRGECRENTFKRLAILRRKTLISLSWVIVGAAAALVLVSISHSAFPAVSRQALFGIASVCSFSWATLGRLGWHQGSFSGATVYEELDTIIFWTLYGIGTLLGVAALFNYA